MKSKFLALFSLLLISGFAVAAPPEHRGTSPRIPEAQEINSNRQSDPDSTMGLDRAEERHELKREDYRKDDYRRNKRHKTEKPKHHKKKNKEHGGKPR